MSAGVYTPEQVGELMNRRQLAGAWLRREVARRLGLSDFQAAVLEQLHERGALRPGQLAEQLGLTSGGVTGLTQRMERSDHISREPHRRDGRSTLLRITPTAQAAIIDQLGPCNARGQELAEEMTEHEREIVGRFLERAIEITERHAQLLGD